MAEAHSQTLSSSNLTEFCEQVNPRVLLEMRRARPFPEMQRVQESWVAAAEKRALLWLAARLPEWIGPDHLTALGLTAQIAAGAGYALARTHRLALLGVIVCLALNWFGDSLDGTLARVRQKLRPRYGFYVDHMVDSFGALALMGGLAVSGYMHPAIAIGLLIAFLMLSIQSYLATHALGEFRLSFWKFGPTELRILLAVGNLALFWKPVVHSFVGEFRLFDVGGAIGLAGMSLMTVFFTMQNTLRLYREERNGAMTPPIAANSSERNNFSERKICEKAVTALQEIDAKAVTRNTRCGSVELRDSSSRTSSANSNFDNDMPGSVTSNALFSSRNSSVVNHLREFERPKSDQKICDSSTLIRWCKFNLVGGMGIFVQFIALFFLKSVMHFNYLAATVIAVEAAVVHNFAWHEQFTWADRVRLSWRASLPRFVRFNLTTGAVSIIGNLALMKVMVSFGHMHYLAANAIAIVLCALVNFLVSETCVFTE